MPIMGVTWPRGWTRVEWSWSLREMNSIGVSSRHAFQKIDVADEKI